MVEHRSYTPRDRVRLPARAHGAVAQSGEHLVCTQEVVGSMPTGSTRSAPAARWSSTPPVRERPRFDSWQGHMFP